jgi:uncharacterized protein YutE (UPF0331/DUF86 family)
MTVEPDVVRRKLLEIEETLGHLRSWSPVTVEALESDRRLRWAVERGLQVAAEALFDVGAHVLAAEFRETADEYRDIPRRLAARQVLSPATAQSLDGLAGFRNVLVHDYADVDLERVVAGLARLGDFDAFVADVERWLQAATPPR